MMNVGNFEILQIAEAVAKEKDILRESVIETMEQAVQIAAKRKYGNEHNIKAEISRKNGEIRLYRVLNVVEETEDDFTQISLKDAILKEPEAKLGDNIQEPLPPIDLGRVAAQSAKTIIINKIRDFERQKQYDDLKNKIGEILNGVVKRIEFGNVYVDVGRTEALIKKENLLKNEIYKINDKIKAYVENVERREHGPQIFLSRKHDMFLVKLLEQEVPEIYDRVIEVKAVARDPGSKAKIAVFSKDSSLDPIGACVGMKGSRVKNITYELRGEKIDVILWSDNIAKFVVNALSPAEISKVVLDEDKNKVEVVVAADQLSLAIGRTGQNVRLASKLTGWNIDVLTEDQESKRRTEEFNSTTHVFMKALDVDEVIAQLLTVEGFTKVEEVIMVDIKNLSSIEGFDPELAQELKTRAENYIQAKNEKLLAELEKLGVTQELLDIMPVSLEELIKLAEEGVKTISDLSTLSLKEFKKILPETTMSEDKIKELLEFSNSHNNELDN